MKVLKITYAKDGYEFYFVVSNAHSFHAPDKDVLISMPENTTFTRIKCENNEEAKKMLNHIMQTLLVEDKNYMEVTSL